MADESRTDGQQKLTRREALLAVGAAGVAGAGLLAAGVNGAKPQAAGAAGPGAVSGRRTLRVAHLTDIHVQPERRAAEGLVACLHHVQSQARKPDVILTGGDAIMDSFESDDARTQLQWDLLHSTLKNECSVPMQHCIGNHDIWGWKKSKANTRGDEPLYGKRRAMDNLGLDRPYRSVPLADSNWRLIVLDSTHENGEGYRAMLDAEQFEWLKQELAQIDAGTPVLVLSHMPILSITPALIQKKERHAAWNLGTGLLHVDAVAIKNLFVQHPNVKVCLSGHVHMVDRVDYHGTTYLCNGAVSGSWWKGKHHECAEGYAMLDLHEDGSFTHEYVTYGWNAAVG